MNKMKQFFYVLFALFFGFLCAIKHAEAKTPFLLDRATVWNSGTLFDADIIRNNIFIQGNVGQSGAGIVLEDRMLLNGAKKIFIEVKGVVGAGNIFFGNRLFKLEVNRLAVKTTNIVDRNGNDTTFIIPKNGTYEFQLSQDSIQKGYINKFEILFYDCVIKKLNLSVWLQ